MLRITASQHNETLRRACGIQLRDHVLDIGCGRVPDDPTGARTARAGSARGIVVSVPAIEHARGLGWAEGLRNVAF